MGTNFVNEHGQPLNRLFNKTRIEDRTATEFIGICRGLLADNVLNPQEVDFLLAWLSEKQENLCVWPFNVIDARLKNMLLDGVIDDEERSELFLLLRDFLGGKLAVESATSLSTKLPLTYPFPEIVFADKKYCFTGKMRSGLRKICEQRVVAYGGIAASCVTQGLDYLVIGDIGSTDWIQSTHGRKIEKAIDYKINIISEELWATAFRVALP